MPHANEETRLGSEVHYVRPDGKIVRLFHDEGASSRLYASIADSREGPWPQAQLTELPDSGTDLIAGNLPDGTAYLIGTQIPEAGRRNLLTLALSKDGVVFDRCFWLVAGAPKPRHRGAGKERGFYDPYAIVTEGFLWVTYSVGREDIAVTQIPLAALK